MQQAIPLDHTLKPISFAWPGGYPVFYFGREGYKNDNTGELEFSDYDRNEFILCADCARNIKDKILTGCQVNWEDQYLYCDTCGETIESAYNED